MPPPLDALPGIFITGTDTHVGKTYLSSLLLRELRREGRQPVPCKPVCSGSKDDLHTLLEAADSDLHPEDITPYYYRTPLAPYAAASLEDRPFDLSHAQRAVENLKPKGDFLLVEGAGGWEVPLAPGQNLSHLAVALELPVLLIIANRLGALNHAILTANAILDSGLPCPGAILNHLEDEHDLAAITNRAVLQETLPIPILGETIHGAEHIDWLT